MARSENSIWSDLIDFLRRKRREFGNKRGRMDRSRFFVNLFLVLVFAAIYIAALFLLVNSMDEAGVPRIIYNNVYFFGVGALFLLLAFGTRPLRHKRLRDMGLPVWADIPFMLLLISNGLGPIFKFFNLPYLRNLDVVNMPANLRDLLGLIWLIWILVLILGPSKRRENLFACSGKFDNGLQ